MRTECFYHITYVFGVNASTKSSLEKSATSEIYVTTTGQSFKQEELSQLFFTTVGMFKATAGMLKEFFRNTLQKPFLKHLNLKKNILKA